MFKNILVPIDLGTEASAQSVPVAIKEAKASGGRIRLINVQPSYPAAARAYLSEDHERKAIEEAKRRLNGLITENDIGDIADATVRTGPVYHEILMEADSMGADLITIVSHHPEISDYLLGSNASRIVRHADCSVLVLRL